MQLSKPHKPKATRKRLNKEILSDDFKKRKIFWKNIAENFPPHITNWDRFFSEFFGFPLSVSFHRRSPNSYHLGNA
jgi:hypothetical protein